MAGFQELIHDLLRFWQRQGCVLLPGRDGPSPAGTLHPEAFCRACGPAAWRSAVLQPVRRPADARGGRHPSRLALHHQLQVLLKPPPEDAQRLYLESLTAVGLEPAVHDLRFAAWSWKVPLLGGWGAGWRVRVDGLGVGHLAFLQRLGGVELEPVSLEVTYGVERLLLALTGEPEVDRLPWASDGTTYGALRRREEAEMEAYAEEVASADALRRQLAELAAEAEACGERGLLRPAYEAVLAAWHRCQMLEAQGELAGGEREGWVERLAGVVAAVGGLAAAGPHEAPATAATESSGAEVGRAAG